MAILGTGYVTHGSNSSCSTSYATRAMEVARLRNMGEDFILSAVSSRCRRSHSAIVTACLNCTGCGKTDFDTIRKPSRPKALKPPQLKPPQLKASPVTEISTADFVGQTKSPCTRRLLLLRHADSSWADRSIKGVVTHSTTSCCWSCVCVLVHGSHKTSERS